MAKCIFCDKEFEVYSTQVECGQCDEGTVEIEGDYGEGSFFHKCKGCNGKGEITLNEHSFCSEGCREEYFDEQFNDNY